MAAISAIEPRPASATLPAIAAKASRPSGGKHGGGIAEHQLGDAFGMRQRESKRDRAAEAVADQDGVIGDAEFLEAVLDRRDVGVHQRQRRRLRAVETRQVDQRDAMLGGERRQHGIEGVAVGEQRMQHHQIAALRRCAPR